MPVSNLFAQNKSNGAHLQRIIPFSFHQIKFFGDAYLITKDGKKGLYSLSGKKIIPCEYDDI